MDNPKKSQQPPPMVTIDQDPLILSAYNSPLSELQEVYKLARETILQRAVELGYDRASMIMHPVNQITDLDSNNNVKVLTYSNVWAQLNLRFVESFAKVLGLEAYQKLFTGQGIRFTAKRMSLEFKKPAYYPDSFLAALRLTELTPCGYTCTITIWSLKQRSIVCEGSCEAYFVDSRTGKRADLESIGGKFAELHADLARRKDDGAEIRRRHLRQSDRKATSVKESKL